VRERSTTYDNKKKSKNKKRTLHHVWLKKKKVMLEIFYNNFTIVKVPTNLKKYKLFRQEKSRINKVLINNFLNLKGNRVRRFAFEV
jgi:hypothetical protein